MLQEGVCCLVSMIKLSVLFFLIITFTGRVYCLFGKEEQDLMIGCDNLLCIMKWFHY